jgi:hypothetical protein
MLDFIFTLLVLVAVGCFLVAIFKALEEIATHMRGNPDAMKAVIEHVFLPLFARKDGTRQVTLEVIDEEKRPEGPPGKEESSNAA